MPVRLGRFEMPKRLQKEEATATETYAKFIADPFETGYGHTIGNRDRHCQSLPSSQSNSSQTAGFQRAFRHDDRRREVERIVGLELFR